MRVEHLAIDGAVVSIEADSDLTSPATAAGWAISPALMQAHPFTIYPPGHSTYMEQSARAIPQVSIGPVQDYTIKNGKLRLAEVELPNATGGKEQLTVGAWEGRSGCLHTSIFGLNTTLLTEIFDTLQFSERSRGLAIDSPVVARPRAPEVIKEVQGLGIFRIRPALAGELERVPKSRGYLTDYGELFRTSSERNDLLFVSASVVTAIKVSSSATADQVLGSAKRLRVEWTPRSIQ